MNWFSQNKITIVIVAVILLLVANYNILNFGVASDFFGIVFSVLLFIFGGRKTNIKVNYILVFLILLFEFICFRLHTKSLHFLALLLLICMVYYGFTKKFSFIAFICILLFSSIFNKFFEHLTVEIKQSLCKGVFYSLKSFMNIERMEGVNFFINGAKITIDTACMGLSMFKTGLLVGAVLLTLEEKKAAKNYTIFQICIFCIVVILLNVVSNYFRIITLVLWNCTQENLLHHTIGIVCFGIYQIFPMLLLVSYFKPKKPEETSTISKPNNSLIAMVFVVVSITSLEMKQEKNNAILENLSPEYPIEKGKWVGSEVFKIANKNKIIYIKTPSHKPLICWTGNGYKVIKSDEIFYKNHKVWYIIMEKNNTTYQSYWWYECGNKKYTSFVEVMWMKLLYNQPIRLINETSVMKLGKF
jgi:exosortase N